MRPSAPRARWHSCRRRVRLTARGDSRSNSARFVCNGPPRFHATPSAHVANIHKTLGNWRAFLCFHRLITTGTPHDRRVIHSILHIPSSPQLRQIDFLSASLSWHAGPFDFREQSAASLLLGHEGLGS
jgi:hypothetical protein